MTQNTVPRFMILILSVCMLVPMSIDIFISGLPAIHAHFPGHSVAMVMGASLLGITISQLFYGPLLDRFGRKPVILTGLLIFTIASVVIVQTTGFNTLLWARFIQAFGGTATVVGVMAITKDTFPKEQLMGKIGLVMAMIGVSPVVAPLIGSFANAHFGWRASFSLLVILGIFYLFVIGFIFKESIHAKNLEALKVSHIVKNYATLLGTGGFLSYCLTSGFTYCILFSYLNISAFIIIKDMGYHVVSYGVIVAVNAVVIVLMAKFSPNLAKKIGLNKTIHLGLAVIIAGGVLMYFLNQHTETLATFMVPMFVTTIGAGIIRPTANGGAMQLAPKPVIGSAAACFNFITFGMGAIASIYSLDFVKTVNEFSVFIIAFGLMPMVVMLIHSLSLRGQRPRQSSP